MHLLAFILSVLRSWLRSRADLAVENLALRQQLAVLRRSVKRPEARDRDRIFWVWPSRFWTGWSSALAIVKPETVVRRHRDGFQLCWRLRSRKRTVGRPKVGAEIRNLVRRRIREMGMTEVVTAPHAPWQNPPVERIIGSIRRECLDHGIILGESHLRRILSRYLAYYHEDRVHMSLERNAPNKRGAEPGESGRIISEPRVGGLHHRYRRAA